MQSREWIEWEEEGECVYTWVEVKTIQLQHMQYNTLEHFPTIKTNNENESL